MHMEKKNSSDHPHLSQPTLRTVWLSLFVIAGFFTHFNLNTNSAPRYSLTKSIVEEGTLAITTTLPMVFDMEKAIDRAEFNGHMYSDKAPFGSFLGVPFYWALAQMFPDEPVRVFFMSIVLNAFPFSLIGILLFQFALRRKYSPFEAYCVVVPFMLGTNLLYWSTTLFSHPLTAFLLLCSILALYERREPAFIFGAGLAYGCAVANDYYVVTGVPLLLVWMWLRSKKEFFMIVAGLSGPALFLMGYHYTIFGNPFSLPYDHHIYFGQVHQQGLSGIGLFSPVAMWTLWFSPSYGLFFFNPLLILFLWSMRSAYRNHKENFFVVGGLLLIFTFIVGSVQERTFGLGSSWGPRYLVCLIPLLIITVVQNQTGSLVRRPLFAALAVLSVVFNYLILWVYILPPKYGALGWLFGDGLMLANRSGGHSALSSINQAYQMNIPTSARVIFTLFVLLLPFVDLLLRKRAQH